MDEEIIDPGELKEKVNNLLWVSLPSNTTLEEAEALAIKIHSKIMIFIHNKQINSTDKHAEQILGRKDE